MYELEREISEADSSQDRQEHKGMSGTLSTLTTTRFSLVFEQKTHLLLTLKPVTSFTAESNHFSSTTEIKCRRKN